MGKTLYLEGGSGISGDMTAAALLDLGGDAAGLRKALASLGVDGYEVRIGRAVRHGFEGCDFSVDLEEEAPWRHGHADHHGHEHRHLSDILGIIDRGALTPRAAELARRIFRILAEAEAKVHGISVDEVHFHEVGAVDSIVDVVSAAVLVDSLGIEDVIVTSLSDGQGTIACRHGVIPVPVPAVVNIVSAYGIPLKAAPVDTEMVTPTGAAIVAALRTKSALPPSFTVEKAGIGLGKRDFGRPNFLRALLIRADEASAVSSDERYILETNIDDSTPEQLGFAMEKLAQAGAVEAHILPCLMKKGRPGHLLRVLCRADEIAKFEGLIFRHTTTIGIRRVRFERTVLPREIVTVDLPGGRVEVKKCLLDGEALYYPEYESVRELAEKTARPFAQVFAEAKTAAGKKG